MEGILAELAYTLVFGLLLIVPAWRIFKRAGLAPPISLIVFVPYVGLLVLVLILAFSTWPAIKGSTESKT